MTGRHFDLTNHVAPVSSDLLVFRRIQSPCYLLLSPLRTSTLLLSLLMTRLCASGVISSSFLLAIQPVYLFRNWQTCLMLMQVILLLRAMLSKQPCFFQLSFFKKPFSKSKLKDHLRCLECQLPLWNSCEGILKLLKEGQSIQHHLPSPS